MRRTCRIHLILSLCATLAQAQGPSPDARLAALYTEEWTWRLRELARTDQPGEAAATDHFPRVDPASQQARLAYWTRALATLDSIPFDSLSAEGKINAQVFRATVTALATDITYRTYEAPFNSDTFFWTEFTPRQGFATALAYRNYLGRLRDVPRYFEEQIANLRAGLARGYTVPRVSTVGRDKTIEPYVQPDTTNPLYAAFTRMPPSIPATDQAAMRAEAKTVIRDVVAPAYGRLLTMMRTEYLPRTRTTLAAADLPAGNAFWSATEMLEGICVNGVYRGLAVSPLTYGSMVLSRPTTDTRGTVKPRARPARILATCSSK